MFGFTGSSARRRRANRALDSARVLDEVVEQQLAIVANLSEDSRRRAADYLAELVMLSQDYRHYARGWIDRRELDRRGVDAAHRLTLLRQRPQEQFTDQD